MRRGARLVLVALVGLAVAGGIGLPGRRASAGGSAPADERRVRDLFRQGNLEYNLGHYDEAIRLFGEAYRLSEHPALLFNMAQASRLKGDCEGALGLYRSFLRQARRPPNRTAVEALVEEMERCVRERAAGIRTDLGAAGPTGSGPPPDGGAGSAGAAGAAGSAGAAGAAGSATGPTAGAAPGPTGAEAPARRDAEDGGGRLLEPLVTRRSFSPTGLLIAAAGLFAAGGGVYFGLEARAASGEIEALYATPGSVFDEEAQRIQARGRRDEVVALVLGGLGAAALVSGTVVFLAAGPRETVYTPAPAGRAGRRPHLAVAPLPGGAALEVSCAF